MVTSAEGSGLRAQGHCPQPPAPSPERSTKGQATLEMAVAMMGALLFLVAAVKIVLWSTERFVTRTQNYDRTRVSAARAQAGASWDNSYEPTKKLEILK